MSAQRPEGPNGPMGVPTKYTLRLTNGSTTLTQSLTVIEDPARHEGRRHYVATARAVRAQHARARSW
jgi:hypothetical protein